MSALSRQQQHLLQTHQIDAAVERLRWDLWSCSQWNIDEVGHLHLTTGDGVHIRWHTDAQTDRLYREQGQSRRAYGTPTGQFRFTAEGGRLQVTMPSQQERHSRLDRPAPPLTISLLAANPVAEAQP